MERSPGGGCRHCAVRRAGRARRALRHACHRLRNENRQYTASVAGRAVPGIRFQFVQRPEICRCRAQRDAAEDISRVLYPNDDTDAGKRLRLKQQYFFSSASLQDMVRAYRAAHGGDFTHFADAYAVQLNDTHPTVAIPELLRLLVEEAGMRFADAVQVAHDTFAYTNHTIMPEALEKWDQKLFRGVLPRVYPYVKKLDALLRRTLEHLRRSHQDAAVQIAEKSSAV